MTPVKFLTEIIDDALVYLAANQGPSVTPSARTLLLAIALQESGPDLEARYQNSPAATPGPARGFWQFERIGVQGVLEHRSAGGILSDMCVRFEVIPFPDHIWRAIEGHDRLACIVARMLLWTDPKPLPSSQDDAWQYYLRNWRPGKPKPNAWPANWRVATETVNA